jgi:hypothetical protein
VLLLHLLLKARSRRPVAAQERQRRPAHARATSRVSYVFTTSWSSSSPVFSSVDPGCAPHQTPLFLMHHRILFCQSVVFADVSSLSDPAHRPRPAQPHVWSFRWFMSLYVQEYCFNSLCPS